MGGYQLRIIINYQCFEGTYTIDKPGFARGVDSIVYCLPWKNISSFIDWILQDVTGTTLICPDRLPLLKSVYVEKQCNRYIYI